MLINGVLYEKKQINLNITPLKRIKKDIIAIVIHYTANPGASADNHFNYWNWTKRKSSCDVVIDQTKILKINDWYKNYTWHIGDGKGKYGYLNSNTIGIEMCINKDGDFDKKTIENAIIFIRYLHKKGFTKKLIRHYDASRKLCPLKFVDLNIKGYNKAYTDFRNKVFAKDEKELYENYKNLKWLYEKEFIKGKNYMSDEKHKYFTCEQTATIFKRIYENIMYEVKK